MKRFFVLIGIICFSKVMWAQSEDKWNVNQPPLELQTYEYEWNEGTWMNIDVHPSGKSIVFDLLGDIYELPIDGGEATLLKGGLAWEIQPKYSPDGKKILYTNDAGGGDNIWVMDRSGENSQQLTKESFRLLNNPEWMPDGQYFIARKHFTSTRSLGAGEMWMYHQTGGKGLGLTQRKNDQQDVNEPSVSQDGKYLYFSEDIYPGGSFQYNKDVNKTIYAIKQYSFESGKVKTLLSIPGGSSRPVISPDGQWLAFIRRIDNKTALCRFNLNSGEIYTLYQGLTKDQQEAWAIFGTYPNFDWTPDGKYIVFWNEGKIQKIEIETGQVTPIPFKVTVKKQVAKTLKYKNKAFTDSFTAKVIRHAVTSPDQRTLVFSALGKLWKKVLPNGKPEILLEQSAFLFEPNFSRDGKKLVFVRWDDNKKGSIQIMDIASGKVETISSEPGIYRNPSFSNDGKFIVFEKEGGNIHQGFTYTQAPGIYTLELSTGSTNLVTDQGNFPQFSPDDQKIYFQKGGYLFGNITKTLHVIDRLGQGEAKQIVSSKYAQRIVPSPDGQWIAWSELYKVYIAPLPQLQKSIDLDQANYGFPVAQVAKDAGINIHWSMQSDQLYWTLGESYFQAKLDQRFAFLNGQLDTIPPLDTVGISIGLQVQSEKPEGYLALTNAKIITMDQDSVIENGSIVIKDNVIIAVGPSNEIHIPENSHIIPCDGKIIMPGIIDVHGHLGDFRYGLSPQNNWYYWANLAFGVTTAHDPSSNSEMVFSHSEMIKAGEMVGPRLFSTGTILYGADGDFKAVINSLDDARSAIRRTKAYGAFSVKSYNQPRRDQRQQVIKAASEENILVMPEGGSTFYHNMTQVVDGHTGIEHNIPVAPLYNDVLDIWASTQAANTPTLIVNYGSMTGENYYYQKYNVWENEKLRRFTPSFVLDTRAKHRVKIPEEEYEIGHIAVAQSLKKMMDRGIPINLGAHGQLQGLGAHWELWMIASGGMTNYQALQTATINGAKYLGMEDQIGSIAPQKLADLLVLDDDPLEDIHHSAALKYTIMNGRVYQSETMEEIWPRSKPSPSFYFQQSGSGYLSPGLSNNIHSHLGQCSCGRH